MKIEQVGVQLYTLRDFLTTPEDYLETLQKVSEIGYKSVEVAGPRPVSEGEIASMCAEKGLVISSCHEAPELVLGDPAKVLEHMEEFGCRYAAYPYPKDVDLTSRSGLQELIRGLNVCGRHLSEAGKVLTYHNHDMELQVTDGIPVLERIFMESDPALLQGMLDVYWLHVADASPEAWCARMKDRLPVLHLKDCAVGPDGQPGFTEVGNGVLDFARIIATAEVSGCQWFVVEQDTCPGDPFESIEKSFRYIRDNLVS
jgi:sugar phosphate isomerase/epimerase